MEQLKAQLEDLKKKIENAEKDLEAHEVLDEDARNVEDRLTGYIAEVIETLRALRAGAGRSEQGRAYSVVTIEAEKLMGVWMYYSHHDGPG